MKIRYLGRTPKVVSLPIPFVSKSERTGTVTCNPVGDFTEEDGLKLLEIAGENGMFVLDEGEKQPEAQAPSADEGDYSKEMPLCACGCNRYIIWSDAYRTSGIPKYLKGHHPKKGQFAKKKTVSRTKGKVNG